MCRYIYLHTHIYMYIDGYIYIYIYIHIYLYTIKKLAPCVPKSILQTSPYCSTVLSPEFGVQCAATWLIEQPVGKAIPARSPFSSTRVLWIRDIQDR